ncbi:MAG: hypothetical protein H6711_07030 [Myxococcales bacterium]|nr:hypothetical protein [Myxococcales bacterium]
MAMFRRVLVLFVGLGLVAASGAIDASSGPDEVADATSPSAESDAEAAARRLRDRGASRLDAALVASLAADDDAPGFELRRLPARERAALLGVAAAAIDGPIALGVREPIAAGGQRLDLVSRGGHVDLRGDHASFRGAPEVFRGPLRPAAYLTFEAEAGHRYLVECAVEASQPGTTFTASDGAASFSVAGDERSTLLYRHERPEDAGSGPVRVVISGDRPGWHLAGCDLSGAPVE